MVAIRTEGLTRAFDSVVALDSLTVELPRGQIVGLLGANGAGKTTLLSILTTLLTPSSGTASVAGHDLSASPLEARKVIGYVPEHGSVYEGLTATEYLQMAGEVRGLTRDEIDGRSERILRHFDLLDERNRRLGTFSKGMRRKVLVTAALLHDPEVLFLDEPMDGLDVVAQRKLADLLRDLVAEGRTVVYSSHVLEQVERLCEVLLFIHGGKLMWCGALDELLAGYRGRSLSEVFLAMTAPDAETKVSWAALLER